MAWENEQWKDRYKYILNLQRNGFVEYGVSEDGNPIFRSAVGNLFIEIRAKTVQLSQNERDIRKYESLEEWIGSRTYACLQSYNAVVNIMKCELSVMGHMFVHNGSGHAVCGGCGYDENTVNKYIS